MATGEEIFVDDLPPPPPPPTGPPPVPPRPSTSLKPPVSMIDPAGDKLLTLPMQPARPIPTPFTDNLRAAPSNLPANIAVSSPSAAQQMSVKSKPASTPNIESPRSQVVKHEESLQSAGNLASQKISAHKSDDPPPSSPRTITEDERSRRRLSDQGRSLLREGLNTSNNSPAHGRRPSTEGMPQQQQQQRKISSENFVVERPVPVDFVRQTGEGVPRKTIVKLNDNYHAEDSSEDELDLVETNVNAPPRSTLTQARFELVTTEQPFQPLMNALYNPVDQSQIVPPAEKTFLNVPYIDAHVWRDEESADYSQNKSSTAVDTLRRSLALSRRSLTTATEALSILAMGDSVAAETGARTPIQRRQSEKRLVERSMAVKEAAKAGDLAKQGLGSDYTMFNRDWSVLLRAKKTTAMWTQLVNRQKHADVDIFVGAHTDTPVATLKSGARASRLLFLERFADSGIAYTIAKEKVGPYRVFWIAEGRRPNGAVDPSDCRFLLIPRKGRAIIKSRGDALPVKHLSSSTSLGSHQALQTTFNSTVLDFLDKSGSGIHIASGMDLVLAFACLIIADRFERYNNFEPDDATRKDILHGRFETDIGEEMDVFQKAMRGDRHGTTAVASSLMY